MDVVELEEEIKLKYPNLGQKDRLMYMDGYMDGMIQGMLEARKQYAELSGSVPEPHPRAGEL